MREESIYQYSVFYQGEPEEGYIAFVPLLPGCHSQGDSLEEAEVNIREAIEVYLESLRANKEAIPIEKKTFHGTVAVPA